jgi:hypothetical protein
MFINSWYLIQSGLVKCGTQFLKLLLPCAHKKLQITGYSNSTVATLYFAPLFCQFICSKFWFGSNFWLNYCSNVLPESFPQYFSNFCSTFIFLL